METIKAGMELKQRSGGLMILDNVQFSFATYWQPQVLPKKNFHWEVTVWGNNGQTTVINKIIPAQFEEGNVLSDEDAEQILHAMIDWANGYQICSYCQTRIKKQNIAGRYFAGSYCAHCWETKYKAIEARETYN